MQFTTVTLAAMSVAVALAADVKVHVVTVSGTTNKLTYTPNNVTAAVGDMVQFQFGVGNHTVTQSAFDSPCVPITSAQANGTGPVYSGFMPVAAGAATVPTYTILVNTTTPMWLYCSQGKHCQGGMTMVINENTKKNASRSLTAYTALAAKAAANLAPTTVVGGSSGSAANTATTTNDTSSTNTTTGTTTTTTNKTSAAGGRALVSAYALSAIAGAVVLASAMCL